MPIFQDHFWGGLLNFGEDSLGGFGGKLRTRRGWYRRRWKTETGGKWESRPLYSGQIFARPARHPDIEMG